MTFWANLHSFYARLGPDDRHVVELASVIGRRVLSGNVAPDGNVATVFPASIKYRPKQDLVLPWAKWPDDVLRSLRPALPDHEITCTENDVGNAMTFSLHAGPTSMTSKTTLVPPDLPEVDEHAPFVDRATAVVARRLQDAPFVPYLGTLLSCAEDDPGNRLEVLRISHVEDPARTYDLAFPVQKGSLFAPRTVRWARQPQHTGGFANAFHCYPESVSTPTAEPPMVDYVTSQVLEACRQRFAPFVFYAKHVTYSPGGSSRSETHVVPPHTVVCARQRREAV